MTLDLRATTFYRLLSEIHKQQHTGVAHQTTQICMGFRLCSVLEPHQVLMQLPPIRGVLPEDQDTKSPLCWKHGRNLQ